MAKQTKTSFGKNFPKICKKKLVLLFVAIILAFVFLIGRITYINAANGEDYTRIVLDQQQYDSRTIPFKRGDIVDRNGTKDGYQRTGLQRDFRCQSDDQR